MPLFLTFSSLYFFPSARKNTVKTWMTGTKNFGMLIQHIKQHIYTTVVTRIDMNTVQICDDRHWTINDKQKYRPRRTPSVSDMHQFVDQFIHMFHLTWHLGTQTNKCFKHQFTFWRYRWANSPMKFIPFWISSNTQLSAFQIHSHKFIQYVFKRLSHTGKEKNQNNILKYACSLRCS